MSRHIVHLKKISDRAWFQKAITLSRFIHFKTSIALVATALVQSLTFVLLARSLGPTGMGVLMLFQAATQLVSEFVMIGAGDAYIRRISRNPDDHRRAFGHALVLLAVTWPVFTVILAMICLQFLNADIKLFVIACFVGGELLGARLSAFSEYVCIAHLNVASANIARFFPAFGRLVVFTVAHYLVGALKVESWLIIQGLSTAFFGILVVLLLVMRRNGGPAAYFSKEDWQFGLVSMFTHLSSTVQLTADRLVLGVSMAVSDVAIYSAATRALQFGSLPIQGVLRNLYPSFFTKGQEGIGWAKNFAYESVPRILVAGAGSALGLVVLSEVLPFILGGAYVESKFVLRSMCFLPALQGIQYLLADVLTGSDRQGLRAVASSTVALLYLPIMFLFIKYFGLVGLVTALYVFQFLNIGVLILIVQFFSAKVRREKQI